MNNAYLLDASRQIIGSIDTTARTADIAGAISVKGDPVSVRTLSVTRSKSAAATAAKIDGLDRYVLIPGTDVYALSERVAAYSARVAAETAEARAAKKKAAAQSAVQSTLNAAAATIARRDRFQSEVARRLDDDAQLPVRQ